MISIAAYPGCAARPWALLGNGFAVQEGVKATHQLRGIFTSRVAAPDRVYLSSGSMGALIMLRLLEQHPGMYAGVLPVCGPIVGAGGFWEGAFHTRALFDYFYPGVLGGDALGAWVTLDRAGEVGIRVTLAHEAVRELEARMREVMEVIRLDLMGHGIRLARPAELSEEHRAKISLFCNVPKDFVVEEKDVAHSIYEVPGVLHDEGLDDIILKQLGLDNGREPDLGAWQELVEIINNYGPLGVLWFDGEWEPAWTHERGVDLAALDLHPRLVERPGPVHLDVALDDRRPGADRVDGRDMLHLYRHDRPGQFRGVPEITPVSPPIERLVGKPVAVLCAHQHDVGI